MCIYWYFFLAGFISSTADLPQQTLPVVLYQDFNGTCPSAEERAVIRDGIQQQVMSLLNITLQNQLPCACGGSGQWTRIAHLNMSDPSQQCPSNWNLTSTPVTGCSSSSPTGPSCDSAIFPSNGLLYSRVCGRVTAYQKGTPDAFYQSISHNDSELEDVYVDGISLTHGAAGSRQHIWTFAATPWEMSPLFGNYLAASCSCTNTDFHWPYEVPSFVGANYFCETGYAGPELRLTIVFSDDPLWDGEGCGPTSTCCKLNTPPWFCTTLPQPTTDDIELRICHDQVASNEDYIVNFVDINVM